MSFNRKLHDFDTFVEGWGRPPPAGELDMREMAEQISRSQKLQWEPSEVLRTGSFGREALPART